MTMSTKPIFLPLKRQYFEAFERGEKSEEFRLLGPRWNPESITVGRAVVLSLGYGKQRRLRGVVRSVRIEDWPETLPGWVECYGRGICSALCIGIQLEGRP